MDLDAYVVHNAEAANAFHQFIDLQGVRRRGHHMHFYAAACCAYDTLDDHQVLETFVLNEQRMLSLVDKVRDLCPAIQATPYQPGILAWGKVFTVPVGFVA